MECRNRRSSHPPPWFDDGAGPSDPAKGLLVAIQLLSGLLAHIRSNSRAAAPLQGSPRPSQQGIGLTVPASGMPGQFLLYTIRCTNIYSRTAMPPPPRPSHRGRGIPKRLSPIEARGSCQGFALPRGKNREVASPLGRRSLRGSREKWFRRSHWPSDPRSTSASCSRDRSPPGCRNRCSRRGCRT